MDTTMKWLKLILVGGCGLFTGQLSCAQDSLISKYTQATLLENWALSHCLALVYKDDTVRKDAEASASAYLEYGKQPIEFYHQIDVILNKYINSEYGGSISSEFNTMKCIDFIHGVELKKLIDRSIEP